MLLNINVLPERSVKAGVYTLKMYITDAVLVLVYMGMNWAVWETELGADLGLECELLLVKCEVADVPTVLRLV